MVIEFDLDNILDGVDQIEDFTTRKINRAVDDGLQELYSKTDLKLTYFAEQYGLSESKMVKSKHINYDYNEFEIGYLSEYANFCRIWNWNRGF